MRRILVHTTLSAVVLTGTGLALRALAVPSARAQEPTAVAAADAEPTPPLGLPPIFWPEDNPYSAAKAELGRFLYFDKRLSSDGTVSCASCHEPSKAYTDQAPTSTGIGKQLGGRNAPTVINRAYALLQFWDGRAGSLEEQAKGPLANPLEMTSDRDANAAHEAVIRRIKGIKGYQTLFRKAFGDDAIDLDRVAKSIATFERTILSGNAPYDRYQAGDQTALTEAQIRGKDIFFKKAECDACHLGFNFSDESYMNIGIGMDKPVPDLGRYKVTGREEDKGAFKTPTLREIEHTAPYMHDGSLTTLEAVVEHYDKGGIKNPHLSDKMEPLLLTKQEKADLVAFLKALSGEGWQHVQEPKADQFPH